jgi:hypothetical protein
VSLGKTWLLYKDESTATTGYLEILKKWEKWLQEKEKEADS